MTSTIKNILTLIVLVFVLGIQQTIAQEVKVQNKVEFMEEETSDFNSIKIPSKKSVTKQKIDQKLNTDIRTIADFDRIIETKKRLRFRNKRRQPEKCFRDAPTSCHTEEK